MGVAPNSLTTRRLKNNRSEHQTCNSIYRPHRYDITPQAVKRPVYIIIQSRTTHQGWHTFTRNSTKILQHQLRQKIDRAAERSLRLDGTQYSWVLSRFMNTRSRQGEIASPHAPVSIDYRTAGSANKESVAGCESNKQWLNIEYIVTITTIRHGPFTTHEIVSNAVTTSARAPSIATKVGPLQLSSQQLNPLA